MPLIRASGRRAWSTWAVGMALCAACALPAQAVTVSLADLGWAHTGSAGLVGPTTTVPLSPAGNTPIGYISTSGGVADVSPLLLKTDGKGSEKAENGSTVRSAAFSADRGDSLSLWFNFVSTDGRGYDDYAWARLLDADNNNALASWVFTARSTNSGSNNIVPGDVLPSNEFDARSVITNYRDYEFTAKTIDWAPLGVSNNICWESDAKGCGFTGWLQSSVTFEKAGRYRLEVGVVNWGDTLFDSGLAFDYAGLVDSRIAPVPEPRTYMMMLAGLMMLGLGARNRLRTRRGT